MAQSRFKIGDIVWVEAGTIRYSNQSGGNTGTFTTKKLVEVTNVGNGTYNTHVSELGGTVKKNNIGWVSDSNLTLAKPATPTFAERSVYITGNSFTISWNPVANASGYVLYYKESSQNKWTNVSTKATNYTYAWSNNAVKGSFVQFKVVAYYEIKFSNGNLYKTYYSDEAESTKFYKYIAINPNDIKLLVPASGTVLDGEVEFRAFLDKEVRNAEAFGPIMYQIQVFIGNTRLQNLEDESYSTAIFSDVDVSSALQGQYKVTVSVKEKKVPSSFVVSKTFYFNKAKSLTPVTDILPNNNARVRLDDINISWKDNNDKTVNGIDNIYTIKYRIRRKNSNTVYNYSSNDVVLLGGRYNHKIDKSKLKKGDTVTITDIIVKNGAGKEANALRNSSITYIINESPPAPNVLYPASGHKVFKTKPEIVFKASADPDGEGFYFRTKTVEVDVGSNAPITQFNRHISATKRDEIAKDAEEKVVIKLKDNAISNGYTSIEISLLDDYEESAVTKIRVPYQSPQLPSLVNNQNTPQEETVVITADLITRLQNYINDYRAAYGMSKKNFTKAAKDIPITYAMMNELRNALVELQINLHSSLAPYSPNAFEFEWEQDAWQKYSSETKTIFQNLYDALMK